MLQKNRIIIIISLMTMFVAMLASSCSKYRDPNIDKIKENNQNEENDEFDNRITKFPTDFPPLGTFSWEPNLASDSLSWNENWIDDSSRTDSAQYKYENGSMRFWTDKGSRQRPKLTHKTRTFKTGQYFWKVYIPAMGMNQRVSIGAFLYHDGDYEIDFEIGSGRQEKRIEYKARKDELLMYLTSQNYPSHQFIHPIKAEKWYDLSIKLDYTKDNKYHLSWYVNGYLLDSVKLNYGKEIPFGIHCSLENIDFIGDTYSTREHYVLFEKVGFIPM